MGFDENMVEAFDDTAETEELPEGIVEEEGESELDLESVLDDESEEEGKEAEDEQEEEQKPQGTGGKKQSEPGYVRKRVDEAVQRATADTEARVRASMESVINERIAAVTAPLIERLVEMDAQELLRKGAVKDIETARELARYRQGAAPAKAEENQPSQRARDEQGRFTAAPKEDPATQARITMLQHQADAIKAEGGPDVIAEFTRNPSAKEKIIRGEMDFYDLAKKMQQAKQKKRPPAPMRSPNGATTNQAMNPIMNMSDEEFARLERRVQAGARIREKQ